MTLVEIIGWMENSRTYRDLKANKSSTCTLSEFVLKLDAEIQDSIEEGNNTAKTDIFITLMRIQASLSVPRSVRDHLDQEIITAMGNLIIKTEEED